MTEELKETGVDVGHRRVGRIMRENSICVERSKKYKVTTDSNHKFIIAPNLLDRDFYADKPNQKWVGPSRDISYGNTLPGNGHQLHLDARGLAVSGGYLGFAFPARDRLGR